MSDLDGKSAAVTQPSQRVVPSLLVRDFDETRAFYERLGFSVTGRHPDGDEPDWIEMSRDGVTLQFFAEPPVGLPGAPMMSGTFYFHPDSVEALADEFRGKVEFAWGPELMPYGMFEFGICEIPTVTC